MSSSDGTGQAYSPRTDTMLMYFLTQIEVRVKWLESSDTSDATGVVATIQDIRSGSTRLRELQDEWTEDAAWTEAYRLERMLALVEPFGNLIPEIRRRLDEAAEDQVVAESRLRIAFATLEGLAIDTTKTPPEVKPTAEPMLRTLLLDILEESHWTAQRRFFARPIAKSATKKIVWVGLASFVLLLVPYLAIFIIIFLNHTPSIDRWTWVALYSALTAGLFGAFFSRLMYIQMYGGQLSLTELKNAREFSSLFLRGAVGMCGALVVFFLLQSNIVNGSLFPDFEKLGFRQIDVPLVANKPSNNTLDATIGRGVNETKEAAPPAFLRLVLPTPDLALLVIWCFLAGFSERLVPTVLSSTEATLSEAAKAKK